MNGKKLLSLLLATLLLCGGMTACLGSDPAPTDTDTESATPPAATDTDTDASAEETTEAETEPVAPLPEPALTIGGTDISAFTVVRSADMPEGQVTVLNLFVEQLQRIYGVALLIITDDQTAEHEIIVGSANRQSAAADTARSQIRNDGYALVVDGGDLYVTATTGRGVVFGLADFMETYMGVRLYSQTFYGHRSTGAVTLEEGFTDVYSPLFEARRTWVDNLYGDPLDAVFYLKNNSDGLKKAKVGDNTPVRANSNHTIDHKITGRSQRQIRINYFLLK